MADHPILYSFRRCPYAMRARLAIAASGQRCELREVVLRDKPEALRLASAKATVPVLVLPDGRVIDESLDIMLWALGLHDPQEWLRGSGDELRDMLDWVAQCDGPFKKHLDRYKYPHRYDLPDGLADRALGAVFLDRLNPPLQNQPYLMGAQISLMDMAIAPFVRQFAHTDAAWFADQVWPDLQRWLAAFEVSALYLSVMDKAPAWQPGQAQQFFPR